MKILKILTFLALFLSSCMAANYANAFEKVGSQNGAWVKKDLLAKVISVQITDGFHKKVISMLSIPKKSKISDFKTSDADVITWPFYKFEDKFTTTIIVERVKKETDDKTLLKMLDKKHPYYLSFSSRNKGKNDAIDVKYALNFKEVKLVKSFKNRP